MIIACKTDVGKKRKDNQDTFRLSLLGKDGYLAVVCDGMGGANGGKLASETAVDAFVAAVRQKYNFCPDSFDLLIYGAYKANEAVFSLSETDEELDGMGTTLAAVMIRGDRVFAVNVGDSRIYADDGELVQISRDHTLVQLLVNMGEMTMSEARKSPDRHKITRVIGVSREVRPDVFEIKQPGYILICSDGLYGEIESSEIHGFLRGNSFAELETALDGMVALANKRGGNDNITAIIIKH